LYSHMQWVEKISDQDSYLDFANNC
jgi:hypothetical protein